MLAIALTLASPALPTASGPSSSTPPSALPGPPPPGQTGSHYLTSVDTALLARTARSDAVAAQAQGMTEALELLDAGSPAGDDGSVRLPDSHANASTAQVAAAAEAYGTAWEAAKGPSLVLVVGVTNYGSHADGAHGGAWALMVGDVARALPGVDVRGGLDAEQEYNTPLATRSWVEAYDASGERPYVDFGNCTCPKPPAAAANGWTDEDVYAVAVGDGRAEALPEIYATKGGNAREWGQLVAWSQQQHPQQPIRVLGVLTEAGACAGPPKRTCDGIDLAPAPAWSQLTVALGLSADPGPDLRFLTDISYLPAPGVRHGTAVFRRPLVIALLVLVAALVSTAVVAFVRGVPLQPTRKGRRRRRRRRGGGRRR
jgi:hypothetical protein